MVCKLGKIDMEKDCRKILKTFCQTILKENAASFADMDFLKKRFNNEVLQTVNVAGAIVLAQLSKAIEGDTVAATWIRDTAGEKPTDRVDVGLLKEGEVIINLSHGGTLSEIDLQNQPILLDNNNKIK